ncbi:uncharacterized protein DSM5745_04632 [Aspergillus mulundensis]|uniref:Uncharacterized protein n=1 Tax=Aspergillus mulundensis TaxID=1810919 RepID=A0A3D8S487_9EURO|nr:hypothetical protein DSM5745_04632 [Aspergillus mulundensis]RDW81075.1 hypothetical protein DSM5745_04632 [Aspergillus mulundensis]
MDKRPELAAMVGGAGLKESHPTSSDFNLCQADDGDDDEDKEDDLEEGNRLFHLDDNQRNNRIDESKFEITANDIEWDSGCRTFDYEEIEMTAEDRILETQRNCLERIQNSNTHAMSWVLLMQLSNLTSFPLIAYYYAFGSMAMHIRLLILEELNFTIGIRYKGYGDPIWDAA